MIPASEAWTLIKPDSEGSPGEDAGLGSGRCCARSGPPAAHLQGAPFMWNASFSLLQAFQRLRPFPPLPRLALLVPLFPCWGFHLKTVLSWRQPMVCSPQLRFPETKPSCHLPSRRSCEFLNGHKEVAWDPAGEREQPRGPRARGTDRQTPLCLLDNSL